jgi:hypothetical protein
MGEVGFSASQAIGNVVITRILAPDVNAQTVEPQRFGGSCLRLQEFQAGRRRRCKDWANRDSTIVAKRRAGSRRPSPSPTRPRRPTAWIGGLADNLAISLRCSAECDLNCDGCVAWRGDDRKLGDVQPGPEFQPYALPDAADRPVPTLLAVRDLAEREIWLQVAITGGVNHPHQQLVVTLTQQGDDIELEGQVTAPCSPTRAPFTHTVAW